MKCAETCTAPLGACCECEMEFCAHLLKRSGQWAYCVECFPVVAK